MSTVKKLTKNLEKEYIIKTFLSPVSMIGEVVMETLIPLLMAKIIDTGIAGNDLPYVLKMGGIMVLCACVSLFFGVMCARLSAVAAQGFSHNLRRNLFAKINEFSFLNYDKFQTSSLVTRLTTDVTNVQNTYQMCIRMCIRAPFMLISGTILACVINIRLSVIFLAAIPVLASALAIIGSLAFPRFRKMLAQYDGLNSTVQENLTGIRVVKSFVREDYEKEKFRKAADTLRSMQVKAERLVIINLPLMQLIAYGCIIAAVWFGGNFIIAGTMKTGELVSFITYITQILMSLMMLSMVFIMLILSRASINRIVEVLDEEPDIKNPCVREIVNEYGDKFSTCIQRVPNGAVEFKNVFFSYVNDMRKCVLENINLSIPSGATVGVIGGTGSGKTTLVSFLPRLYDPSSGSVCVGGIDVRKYDLATLRNNVACVLQKNVLFSGTIRENLKWGNEKATDEEIIQACKASDAYDFIMGFPEGFETDLGQGGVNLSGGQKQRLCIARALLKKPQILILDDSTSAVDTATDKRIRDALKGTLRETTKIIIAQRINSVMDADMIIVMDKGKVCDVGTHDQLMERCGIYREVWDSQQSAV